jgi:hypothetical protein
MVELGQRPTQSVDEHEKRNGRWFIREAIDVWVWAIKRPNGWVRRDRGGVRVIGRELSQDTGICLESCGRLAMHSLTTEGKEKLSR